MAWSRDMLHTYRSISDRMVVHQQKKGMADSIGCRTWSKALRCKQVVIQFAIMSLAKSAGTSNFKTRTHTHTHTHKQLLNSNGRIEDWPWLNLRHKTTLSWTNLSQAKGKLYHLYNISGIYENDPSAGITTSFQVSKLSIFKSRCPWGCFSHA